MRGVWLQAIVVGLAFCAGCASRQNDHQQVSENPYRQPLVSPGGQFGSLPPAVQNSVRAQTGSTEIEGVAKTNVAGRMVYEIRFQNPELFPPMYVAQDGSVLNPDLSVAVGAPRDNSQVLTGAGAGGLKFEDLPGPAASVVRSYGPVDQIAAIDRQMWGNRLTYIVSFKDEVRYPKLYLASDGTVLKEGHK
jgi:hypothetical protein